MVARAIDDPVQPHVIHASCVAKGARGLLILGKSGQGKSALALQMIALGAELVADDRTAVTVEGGRVMARCPDAIAGRIEARGVGILHLPHRAEAEIVAVVDLDQRETARLPEAHHIRVAGQSLPCLHDPAMAHFPAALIAYLGQIPQTPRTEHRS